MGSARNKGGLRLLAACALWIAVWQAASLMLGSKLLLPGPVDTCLSLVRVVGSAAFLPALWFSFSRVASGFLVAFALGVGLGFAAHRLALVRTLLEPVVLAFKSIPVACITVLLLIWVGSREVSGICVFLMAFPALYLATIEGLAQVDPKVGEMLAAFGVNGSRCFLAHVWPSVLPYLVATSRNACGMAWKAGVAAELIGTPVGSVGERIYQAKILLETADLFAWTFVVVAVSYLCERAFLWLLQRTGPVSLRLAVPRRASRTHAAPEPGALLVEHGVLGYDGQPVLHDVQVRLAAGERGVLGDVSGAGKTTLLHSLAGLLPTLGGTVEAPRALSMVFQEPRLVERLTPCDNVLLVGTAATPGEVRSMLLELLGEDALTHPVSELSGGQRRRVEIVRAMAHPSSAVLMDEPFSSLDEESHRLSAAFVLRHLGGRTMLVASHAPEDVRLLDAQSLSVAR